MPCIPVCKFTFSWGKCDCHDVLSFQVGRQYNKQTQKSYLSRKLFSRSQNFSQKYLYKVNQCAGDDRRLTHV